MTTSVLLAEFERLEPAPNAVLRLRRLILDLAVRGRLLPDSQRVVRAQALEQNRGPWAIPPTWEFVPLSYLAAEGGLFTDGDWIETKDQDPGGDVRLTQLADVGVGTFRDRSSRFMRSEVAERLKCTYLKVGDILIARMPDPIGRACRYPGGERPAVTAVDVAILRSTLASVDADYVVYALNSPSFSSLVMSHIAGTTRQRISRGNLSRLPFPLPPAAEQRRIVADVDQLLALCADLEIAQALREKARDRATAAALHQLAVSDDVSDKGHRQDGARFYINNSPRLIRRPEHVAGLRRTILELAVRGRLVPQDPRDDRVSDLGAGDLVEGEQAPWVIPEHWLWATLGTTADFSAGRTPSRNDPSYWNTGDYAWISIADMSDGQRVVTTKETVSEKAKSLVFASNPLPVGTMIMSFKLTIGKIATLGIPAFHNEAIVSIRPRVAEMAPYLFKVLPERARAGATRNAIKGATLNRKSLSNIHLPIPPLAEQHRIVAKVDELMAACDELDRNLTSLQDQRVRFLEAVLAECLSESGVASRRARRPSSIAMPA